jgi:Leucine-rich repeat (LRR) protein
MNYILVCSIQVLDLSNNQISYVPEISFIKNHKLTSLDLSKNQIRTLPRDSLVGSHIEILNLSSNQFVNLPVGALTQVGGTNMV